MASQQGRPNSGRLGLARLWLLGALGAADGTSRAAARSSPVKPADLGRAGGPTRAATGLQGPGSQMLAGARNSRLGKTAWVGRKRGMWDQGPILVWEQRAWSIELHMVSRFCSGCPSTSSAVRCVAKGIARAPTVYA